MEITRNNIGQMYDILSVYGSVIVKDVINMIACCDIMTIKETWEAIGMKRHVECVDELLKIKA